MSSDSNSFANTTASPSPNEAVVLPPSAPFPSLVTVLEQAANEAVEGSQGLPDQPPALGKQTNVSVSSSQRGNSDNADEHVTPDHASTRSGASTIRPRNARNTYWDLCDDSSTFSFSAGPNPNTTAQPAMNVTNYGGLPPMGYPPANPYAGSPFYPPPFHHYFPYPQMGWPHPAQYWGPPMAPPALHPPAQPTQPANLAPPPPAAAPGNTTMRTVTARVAATTDYLAPSPSKESMKKIFSPPTTWFKGKKSSSRASANNSGTASPGQAAASSSTHTPPVSATSMGAGPSSQAPVTSSTTPRVVQLNDFNLFDIGAWANRLRTFGSEDTDEEVLTIAGEIVDYLTALLIEDDF